MPDSARFERLVTDLSARFIAIDVDRLDDEIDRALEQVVEFFGTDRSTFLELLPAAGDIIATHSWARPGIRQVTTPLRMFANFPWYHARLRRGETLRLEHLPDDLPVGASAEREYASRLPMLSHVAIPLLVGGRWVCALLTATARKYRSWSDLDAERARVLGQILANATHRRQLESELGEGFGEERRLRRDFDATGPLLQTPARASERLDELERAHFLRVLERCDWRINGPGNAAESLGIHPNTLRSRLKKLGIVRPGVTRSRAGRPLRR